MLDKFLGKEFLNLDINESSNWEFQSLTDHFHYDKNDIEFVEYSIWITEQLQKRNFLDKANRFIEIKQLLKTEPAGNMRSNLINELSNLSYG